MKKIITLFIALIIVLSFAACGVNDTENKTVSASKQTDTQTSDVEETSTNEAISSDSDDETSANAPAFDASWASNEFESQIAKPEFESWEVRAHTEGQSWEIFVQDVHYDTVKEYANDLRSYGFAINESENDGFSGLAYIFEADNEGGYHAKLTFEAGDADGNGSFSLKISK